MLFCRNFFHSGHLILLFLLSLLSITIQAADKQTFTPFVLATQATSSMAEAKAKVTQQIAESPFSIVAEYSPYEGAHIYIISSDELQSLAAQSTYGGFAAPQRVSLTQVNKGIQIAYTNPVFMQHAYRMKNVDLQPILNQMTKAFGLEQFFGAEGLSDKKLRRFNYAFGMEKFNHFYELPEYPSHTEAIAALKKGFSEKDNGISEIYEIKIPGKEQVVFGVAMSAEDSGDDYLDVKKTMAVIDHKSLKRTAFLPYEIMIDGQNIIAMHARFRIAVNFSELKMFGKHGFGKLFSTPTAYHKAFTKVSGGNLQTVTGGDGFID